jgi:hypothetical protein
MTTKSRFEDAVQPGHHVRAMRALDRVRRQGRCPQSGSSEARALTTARRAQKFSDVMAAPAEYLRLEAENR